MPTMKLLLRIAPMAGAFQDAGPEDPYLHSIRDLLSGEKMSYTCEPHPFNRKGEAEGVLMGGNLHCWHMRSAAFGFKQGSDFIY